MTLTLGVSRSESDIALSQEWGAWLTWNEKDVSHPFKTMILTSVTMVGWADVPDSDRGDFRRRRAVDISSWLCSHHRIIMKFSEVITNDQSKVHAKGQGQRSKVKVTEVTTQLKRFRTVTPVWIHIWWWNDAYSLMLLRPIKRIVLFPVLRPTQQQPRRL